MRILAIGAHPDDVEHFAGGTLALYAQQGHDVFIAIATRGDIGSPSGTRDEIAATRRQEAERSCAVIGATLIWMGFDDEFLFNDRPTRLAFIDAIREARPDVMFLTNEHDYHPDHRTAGTLGRDARIPASVPLIETRFPAVPIPTTFVMDIFAIDGRVVPMDHHVDIGAVLPTKREMLAQHASQIAWMQSVYDSGSDETMTRDRLRGAEIGVEFAEAFRLLDDYPYTGGPELLPIEMPR